LTVSSFASHNLISPQARDVLKTQAIHESQASADGILAAAVQLLLLVY